MKRVQLSKTGEKISIIGQRIWGIKEKKDKKYCEQWNKSLRKGIELGVTHINTDESYGKGVSEKIVGDVLIEYDRDDLFITGKLSPRHFSYKKMKKAAYNNLERLGIKYFDLYLMGGYNPLISIKKQMKVLEELVDEGKTRYIGVSSFSVNHFKLAQQHLKKVELVNNQLKASIENPHQIHKSLHYYQKQGITITVYNPSSHYSLDNLFYRNEIEKVARIHNASIQQISIAWLINQENVITIINPFRMKDLTEEVVAIDLKLNQDEIDRFYKIEDEIELGSTQWI